MKKVLYAVVAAALIAAGAAVALPSANAATTFVSRNGAGFDLNGAPFRFGGANNYYLHYKSQNMVEDVFANAQSMGLTVIRAWTFLECGGDKPNSPNGGCSAGPDNWMQRWSNTANGGAGGVVYNDTGAGGLVLIDRMVASAAAHGIKLILPFTGNWKDFGGMDQYVTWYGLPNHDQFYTDTRIQQDYKNWINHLVNRVNTITGIAYRNDPTIFAWELANEPRCIDANLPTSGTCTATTLTNWAATMSTYIKSLDANHMVSVGDEGFHPGTGGSSSQWPYNITDGVDHAALTALPNIDFGTYHLYPQGWGQSPADTWGTQWINDHNAVGTSLTKPEILEEFGTTDQGTRDATYTAWTNAVRTGGGDGWNVWLLTARDDSNGCTPFSSCPLYPDFDGFRVTVGSSTATVLSNAAAQIATGGGDTTAPTTPGTPSVSAITNTGATLSWTASTDTGGSGLAGYNVYRRVGTTDTLLTSTTTASATLTGLSAGTQYVVTVRARDGAGNLSTASATATFTTTGGGGDTTPPSTPTGVTVSTVAQTSATVSWTAATDNVGVTAYDVLLTRGGTTTTSTVTGTPPPTTLALTGLVAATAYSVAVRARDAAGNQSAASAAVAFTTTGGATGGCVVTYRVVNQWPGGFQGDVTIRNNATAPVNGWQLAWTFANGQSITQIWGAATPVPSAAAVTATNLSWNATIGASGGTVNFGFLANWNTANTNPTAFTLNGAACTAG